MAFGDELIGRLVVRHPWGCRAATRQPKGFSLTEEFMFLENFKWYRKYKRGKWAKVTGFLFGTRWIQIPMWSLEKCDENHGVKNQVTYIYCPACNNELCSDPLTIIYITNDLLGIYTYRCRCKHESTWNISTPVPLLCK